MGSQPSRGRGRAYIPSLMATKLWCHHQKSQTQEIEPLQDKNYNAGMISEILYEMNGAWLEFSHWHAENWDSNLENSLKKQAFIMQ